MSEVPLPQETKLYQSTNNSIVEPVISLQSLDFSGNNNEYLIYTTSLKYLLYNQKAYEINLIVDDRDVSCIRAGLYYALNGFDYGFDYRLLNSSSPTICYAPLVSATDKNTNVTLNATSEADYYEINDYGLILTSSSLQVNQYILLRNQSTNAENLFYKITKVEGTRITVYDDSSATNSINYIVGSSQYKIFVRAKVEDDLGISYFGLYNEGGTYWVPQNYGIKLRDADYLVSINTELTSNRIAKNLFPADLELGTGDVVAINVKTNGLGSFGGKSSGLYNILRQDTGYYYIESIYDSYVNIHQFFKVKYDDTIWYVDPLTVKQKTHMFGSVNFCFSKYYNYDIKLDPSLWAKQVGGRGATVLGCSVFTNPDEFIQESDEFSIAIKCPTWSEKTIKGLGLIADYKTNQLTQINGVDIN